jgi:hypothetical protein
MLFPLWSVGVCLQMHSAFQQVLAAKGAAAARAEQERQAQYAQMKSEVEEAESSGVCSVQRHLDKL